MCALLLIRGASESATVNTVMVLIKLGVLALFVAIAFTAFSADRFADFACRRGLRGRAARHDLLLLHRTGCGVHRRRRGEEPQKTMPRAIILALIIVTRSTSW